MNPPKPAQTLEPRTGRAKTRRAWRSCLILALFCGAVITLAAALAVQYQAHQQDVTKFHQLADNLGLTLASQIGAPLDAITAIVEALANVESWAEKDRALMRSMMSLTYHTVTIGALAQYITHAERPQFEAEVGAIWNLSSPVLERDLITGTNRVSSNKSHYLPYRLYLDSVKGARGFDLFSEPQRNRTVRASRAASAMRMTAATRRLTDGETIFLTTFPLFRADFSACSNPMSTCNLPPRNTQLEGGDGPALYRYEGAITACLQYGALLSALATQVAGAVALEDVTDTPAGIAMLSSAPGSAPGPLLKASGSLASSVGALISVQNTMAEVRGPYAGVPLGQAPGVGTTVHVFRSGANATAASGTVFDPAALGVTLRGIVSDAGRSDARLVSSYTLAFGGHVLVFHVIGDASNMQTMPQALLTAIIAGIIGSLVLACLCALCAHMWWQHLQTQETRLRHAGEIVRVSQETHTTFMAYTCHSVRNPLTRIVGSLDLIEYEGLGGLSRTQRSEVGALKRCCAELVRIISDLNDLNKLEGGGGSVQLEESMDVRGAVLSAVAGLRASSLGHSRKVAVRYSVSPNVPAFVTSDAMCLSQLLGAALTNAAQHGFAEKSTADGGDGTEDSHGSPRGVVGVQLSVTHEADSSGGSLVFVVTNTSARGLGERSQSSLFTPFTAAALEAASSESHSAISVSNIARRALGVGLGLPIAYSAAARLGGAVSLTDAPAASEDGEGQQLYAVTFKCSMPLRKDSDLGAAGHACEPESTGDALSIAPEPRPLSLSGWSMKRSESVMGDAVALPVGGRETPAEGGLQSAAFSGVIVVNEDGVSDGSQSGDSAETGSVHDEGGMPSGWAMSRASSDGSAVSASDACEPAMTPTTLAPSPVAEADFGKDVVPKAMGLPRSVNAVDPPTVTVAPAAPLKSRLPALGLRVCAVDDEASNRKMVRRMLENLGCTAHLLSDGADLEAHLREVGHLPQGEGGSTSPGFTPSSHYDAILLDIVMPRSDGAQVCHRLTRELGVTLPIIAASGNLDGGEAEFGFSGCLAKPFTMQRMHELLAPLARTDASNPSPLAAAATVTA